MQASQGILQMPIQSDCQLKSFLNIIKEVQQKEQQKCIKFIMQSLIPNLMKKLKGKLINQQEQKLLQTIDSHLQKNKQITFNDLAKLFSENQNTNEQELISKWKEILEQECKDLQQGKQSQEYYDKYYTTTTALLAECNKLQPYKDFKIPNPVPISLKIRKTKPKKLE